MNANPRYPHKCVIFRREGVDSFNPQGVLKVLYRGECRKSGSTNIRTFNTGSSTTGKVDVCDYRVSAPGLIRGIRKGDMVLTLEPDMSEIIVKFITTDLPVLSGGSPISMQELNEIPEQLRIVSIEHSILGNGTAVLCNTSSN